MKQIFMLLAAMLLTACSKDDEVKAATVQEAGKTLVVYYSYTNNCNEIVSSLTSQIQADVMRIEPADKTQKYEENNYAIGTALLNAIKDNPNDAASYPAIDPVSITDLSQYQNIIIVTPLWWSQMAAIMQAYLFHQGSKMAGKKIALIVSSHSTGISGVVEDARRLIPEGIFEEESLWIHNSNRSSSASLIAAWLPKLSFKSSNTTMTDNIYLTIDGVTKKMTLADNAATHELVEALGSGDITVTVNDNDFEQWGSLGRSFTTGNEYITCQPGDVVLYAGSNICLFYGTNSYSYTRLGKIEYQTLEELKSFLKAGQTGVKLTLSLTNGTTAVNSIRSEQPSDDAYYSLDGKRISKTGHGLYIHKGKKLVL